MIEYSVSGTDRQTGFHVLLSLEMKYNQIHRNFTQIAKSVKHKENNKPPCNSHQKCSQRTCVDKLAT